MLVNELRIGNYVKFCSEYCKVIEIQKDCFYAENKDKEEFKNNTTQLDPIPLNESIISTLCGELNKFSGDYRLQVTDDYSMSFSLDNDMIYVGDLIELRISETPVHRLQNLYLVLSGKELTLNL
jgi:hypothetical protein